MGDRETVIRLSSVIERLRAQIRAEEEALLQRKVALSRMEAELDKHLAKPIDVADEESGPDISVELLNKSDLGRLQRQLPWRIRSAPVVHDVHPLSEWREDWPTPLIKEERGSLSSAIKQYFAINPSRTFTASRLITTLGLPSTARMEASIRQILKRLFDENVLMKVRDGEYHWNPVKDSAAPQLNGAAISEALEDDDE